MPIDLTQDNFNKYSVSDTVHTKPLPSWYTTESSTLHVHPPIATITCNHVLIDVGPFALAADFNVDILECFFRFCFLYLVQE